MTELERDNLLQDLQKHNETTDTILLDLKNHAEKTDTILQDLKNHAEKTDAILLDLKNHAEKTDARLESIENRMDKTDARLESIEESINQMKFMDQIRDEKIAGLVDGQKVIMEKLESNRLELIDHDIRISELESKIVANQ